LDLSSDRILDDDVIINVRVFTSSNRYSCQTATKLYFLDRFSKNAQKPNFMKIRPVGAELFHADGGTGGHDEANSGFSPFWECA